MDGYYRVPTLVLLGLLVSVFAALYAHSRTQRRLLWLIGWIAVTLRVSFLVLGVGEQGFGKAVGESAVITAAIMFLGALSLASWPFHIFGRQLRIFYSVTLLVPVICFAVSTALVPVPGLLLRSFNILALVAVIAVCLRWSLDNTVLPHWFNAIWSIAVGTVCAYFTYLHDYQMVLWMGQGGIDFLVALLVLAVYRRLSPGVVFTAAGFFLWSILILIQFLLPPHDARWRLAIETLNLIRVITGVGMIVLVLEDEARENESAQRRDRRARREMERYAHLDLSVEPQRDFGIQYSEVCSAIVEAARFRQAAIYLIDVERNLRLAASCGWDATTSAALDTLGGRLSLADLRRCWADLKSEAHSLGRVPPISLHTYLAPGDDPELHKLTGVYTLPITARSGDLQGILMLAGIKDGNEPLLPEDLLPLQLLVARVAAARENGLMSRSIARSEKLAGIGRLAGGVAHELNNPLTVVMGYAELIHESSSEETVRREAAIIRNESQRMKQIIESLGRFWKPSPSPVLPIAIPELLAEVDSLRRSAFERSHIRFDVIVSPGMPRVIANDEQMRQILLQLLDTAAAAASSPHAQPEKRIRMEATGAANHVQIVISNSGPGFSDPEKVFDPFFNIKPPGEGPALALSLCYSVVREQGGDLSAINLKPHGGAVVLELPAEPAPDGSSLAIHRVSA